MSEESTKEYFQEFFSNFLTSSYKYIFFKYVAKKKIWMPIIIPITMNDINLDFDIFIAFYFV